MVVSLVLNWTNFGNIATWKTSSISKLADNQRLNLITAVYCNNTPWTTPSFAPSPAQLTSYSSYIFSRLFIAGFILDTDHSSLEGMGTDEWYTIECNNHGLDLMFPGVGYNAWITELIDMHCMW